VVKIAATSLAIALAACGSFDDPAIVIDLRIIGIAADPPEQVFPYDLENPPEPADVEFAPIEVCARVADPGVVRDLEWEMKLCPRGDDLRCQDDATYVLLGTGTLADPELSSEPQFACATYQPDPVVVFVMLQEVIEDDPLAGFSGVDLEVELRVRPVGAPDEEIVGAKRLRFAPQIPIERTANTNPSVERFAYDNGAGTPSDTFPLGRCRDQAFEVDAGEVVRLLPVEPAFVRETYVVPTFDGGSRTFTENMRYQWLAGAGSWSSPNSGGPKDGFGNEPSLQTTWRSPEPGEIEEPLDVPIWVIQRDERLGVAIYETCVRVMP
jgi:hypothetical protein